MFTTAFGNIDVIATLYMRFVNSFLDDTDEKLKHSNWSKM